MTIKPDTAAVFMAIHSIQNVLDELVCDEVVAISALTNALAARVARLSPTPEKLEEGVAITTRILEEQIRRLHENPKLARCFGA